jgi:tetratricopeptide (TPR) repeat protein
VAGILAGWQGNTAYALQLLHENLRLLRQEGDRRGIVWALLDLGRTHQLAGNFEIARQILEECLSLLPEAGERQLEGFALGTYGTLLRFLGYPDDAVRHVEMALAIADELGDIRARAIWLYNLGYIEVVLGREEAARRHLRDGLRAARSVSDSRFVIECLDGLAVTMLDQDPRRAARLFGLVAKARTSISYPVFAGRRPEHDQQLVRLIDALGEEPFAQEWDRGARLSLDAAIDLALACA